MLVTPQVKLDTMLWLFGAFCFLSLLSPIAIAVIPLLLERMLANTAPNWWVTVLPLQRLPGGRPGLRRRRRRRPAGPVGRASLAAARARQAAPAGATPPPTPDTAAADTAPDASAPPRRCGRNGQPPGAGTVALVCAAAIFAVALCLIPRFAFGPALHRQFYQRNAPQEAAAAAVAVVPSGVTVEAVTVPRPAAVGPGLRSCCGTETAELPRVRAVGGRRTSGSRSSRFRSVQRPEAAGRTARARWLPDRLPARRVPRAAPRRSSQSSGVSGMSVLPEASQ